MDLRGFNCGAAFGDPGLFFGYGELMELLIAVGGRGRDAGGLKGFDLTLPGGGKSSFRIAATSTLIQRRT